MLPYVEHLFNLFGTFLPHSPVSSTSSSSVPPFPCRYSLRISPTVFPSTPPLLKFAEHLSEQFSSAFDFSIEFPIYSFHLFTRVFHPTYGFCSIRHRMYTHDIDSRHLTSDWYNINHAKYYAVVWMRAAYPFRHTRLINECPQQERSGTARIQKCTWYTAHRAQCSKSHESRKSDWGHRRSQLLNYCLVWASTAVSLEMDVRRSWGSSESVRIWIRWQLWNSSLVNCFIVHHKMSRHQWFCDIFPFLINIHIPVLMCHTV